MGAFFFPFDLHRRTWVEFGKTGSIVVNAVEGEENLLCVVSCDYITVEPEHTVAAAYSDWGALVLGPFSANSSSSSSRSRGDSIQCVKVAFRVVKWKSRM